MSTRSKGEAYREGDVTVDSLDQFLRIGTIDFTGSLNDFQIQFNQLTPEQKQQVIVLKIKLIGEVIQ